MDNLLLEAERITDPVSEHDIAGFCSDLARKADLGYTAEEYFHSLNFPPITNTGHGA